MDPGTGGSVDSVGQRKAATAAALLALATVSACGSSAPAAPPAVRATAPEPAVAPPIAVTPAGTLIPVGREPEGIVADGPTDELAVSVRGGPSGNGVELVSLAQRKVIGFTPTAGAARHLQLAAPGGPVLVPAEGSDTLYRLSLGAAGIISSAKVGRQPHDAAALAGAVLVTDELADHVTVLRGDTVTATVPVPVQPGGIAGGTETDGHTPVALVVGVRGRQVEALTPTGSSLGRAAAGAGPSHVRFGGGRFYVADTSGDRILIYTVDRNGPRQVGSVALAGTPYGLAVDPGRGRLWVTLTARNQVEQLRITGNTLVPVMAWPTPRQPNDVTVDPVSGTVVVCGTGSDQLQLITP